jgi:serine/threonine-protein kinase
MLAGETPFKAANTPAMLVKHVSERPRPLRERRPDIPAYLAVAIDRALAKRPEDRFTDAAEFRDALDSARVPPARNVAPPAQAAAMPQVPIAGPFSVPVAPLAPPAPSFPSPPPGLSKGELKHWYRAQRKFMFRQQLANGAIGIALNDRAVPLISADSYGYDDRPLEDRVVAFRRSVLSWAAWSFILFGINIVTRTPPWFFIPSGFMFIGVAKKLGSIWSDGIGPLDAFKKGIRRKIRAERGEPEQLPSGMPSLGAPARASMTPEQAAAQLAVADVLAGPHGETVRRAATDRLFMREIIANLRPIERDMIPDVGPTLDALAQRVGAVATTLHRLDTDVSGASLGSLDARIASIQTEPDTSDRERRLSLLQRQRDSLHELLERRRSLANQLESASLMLQNLKFDLLKFRSSGLGSAIEDQTSATQEARALSREIGHVVQAAEDLRKL